MVQKVLFRVMIFSYALGAYLQLFWKLYYPVETVNSCTDTIKVFDMDNVYENSFSS